MNVRTNIVIDEKLMRRAMKATGSKTRREAVDIELRQLVLDEEQMKAQRAILELAGADMIDPDYDYKRARSGD